MNTKPARFILYSGTFQDTDESPAGEARWHFALESVDGISVMEADEVEPDVVSRGERLELLAVVRGLEALDQPSRVTLVTPSRYVRRGLRYGLEEWRRNQWCWEHFGKLVPIKNQDLWQRVDRALRYHEIECRYWRVDAADHSPDNTAFSAVGPTHLRRPGRRAGGTTFRGRFRLGSWLAKLFRTFTEALPVRFVAST